MCFYLKVISCLLLGRKFGNIDLQNHEKSRKIRKVSFVYNLKLFCARLLFYRFVVHCSFQSKNYILVLSLNRNPLPLKTAFHGLLLLRVVPTVSINRQAFYHQYRFLIGYTTHYLHVFNISRFYYYTNANAVIWLAEPLHTISNWCGVAGTRLRNGDVFFVLLKFGREILMKMDN